MASPSKKSRSEPLSDDQYANCIRALAIDTIQKANSGHPGAPMGMAPVAHVLFGETLVFDPKAPLWHNRDRFVLSNGHASALLYSMLHLCGYNLTLDDLKNFRQLGSKTPGHPERHVTDGVEVTTGPLGQGIANSVGIAIAEAHLASVFNKPGFEIVNHRTFVFCGDGCLMEGVAQEALSLAGHLALEKLTIIYDDNNICIDGNTSASFTERSEEKYRAMGFHTIVVTNGNTDFTRIRQSFQEALAVPGKPKMILLRTTIGFGAKLENTHKVHGAPLGAPEIERLKETWGRDPKSSFAVEDAVYAKYRKAAERGAEARKQWEKTFAGYKKQFPEDGTKYEAYFSYSFPNGWEEKLPRTDAKSSIATRKASENVLASLLPMIPNIVGGSADLTGSNLTRPESAKLTDFQKETPIGRYLRFGVREHGMCAILNGIDAHGGLIAYGGTFLNFVSYALGAVRLAAMSEHGVIYVATHDSIGLGEDGPTHQPVETLTSLRSTPNTVVIRPADQTETSAAWAVAVANRNRPTCLALSRQNTKPLAQSSFEGTKKGAYIVRAVDGKPDGIIVSSGSEVGICLDAAEQHVGKLKIRVVSMPSWELFNQQTLDYQRSVLGDAPVLAVEPFAAFGWDRYAHAFVGLPSWGASAPSEKLYEKFGLTPSAIGDKVQKLVQKFAGSYVPKPSDLSI